TSAYYCLTCACVVACPPSGRKFQGEQVHVSETVGSRLSARIRCPARADALGRVLSAAERQHVLSSLGATTCRPRSRLVGALSLGARRAMHSEFRGITERTLD